MDRAWIDKLVDLQVLARHGDLEAIVAAHQWLSVDADARHLWAVIAEHCAQLSPTATRA